MLIGVFAVVAVVLACVGLYGVRSTAVRQRTADIGVRVALGASRPSVFGLVVGHGMKLSTLGRGLGLVAAFGMIRSPSSLLIGVQPTDVSTHLTIVTLILGMSLGACAHPVRRAANLDPLKALRSD